MKSRRHKAIFNSVEKTNGKRYKEFVQLMDNSNEFVRVAEHTVGRNLYPHEKVILRQTLRNSRV